MSTRTAITERVERIRRRPDDCRHTIPVDSEAFLRLKYSAGAITKEKLFVGAVAVIRGKAQILNGKDQPIPPVVRVICRRNCFNGAVDQLRIGVPVEVIDPGRGNSFLVLTKGSESNPTIAKSVCRPLGTCRDASEQCGKCCNNKKDNK